MALEDARAVGDVFHVVWALFLTAVLSEEDDAAGHVPSLAEALALARASGNLVQVTFLLPYVGAALVEAGNLQRAHLLLDERRALARAAGDGFGDQMARLHLGWLAVAEGDLEDAAQHLRSIFAPSGRWGVAPIPAGVLALGQVCLLRGDLDEARALCCQALIHLQDVEPGGLTMANALVDMACVEAAAGRHARAHQLLGANDAWYAAHGGMGHVWRNPLKRGLPPAPLPPADPSLVRARAAGRVMRLDEAVVFALQDVAQSNATASGGVTPSSRTAKHVGS